MRSTVTSAKAETLVAAYSGGMSCYKAAEAAGLNRASAQRYLKKHGLLRPSFQWNPPMERLFGRVEKSGDCLIWTGAQNGKGYGHMRIDGRMRLVHHVALLFAGVQIPDGLVCDHLCRNRACIRINHLEFVTHGENLRRGNGTTGQNFRKTHCIHGHPFDEVNTYRRPDGNRDCRACWKARRRKMR